MALPIAPTIEARHLYLARIERGRAAKVYAVLAQSVQMPNPDKARAKIAAGEPAAWLFGAERSALVQRLCSPGAAAVDTTPARAIEAAMKLFAQYERARMKR